MAGFGVSSRGIVSYLEYLIVGKMDKAVDGIRSHVPGRKMPQRLSLEFTLELSGVKGILER